MKKTLVILLSLSMIWGLIACGRSSDQAEQPSAEENTVQDTANDILSEENNDTASEKSNDTDVMENIDIPETQPEEAAEVPDAQEQKILVAYFSATNTTKGVAEKLADGIGADLYEIVPEEPYMDADLNYHDDNSRTTIEMNDPDVRPAISGSIENMEQYDVVFIGYPIWWAEAPRIINTFVESYDFSGKTIVPFCTSGGSGIGSSATNLHSAASGAKWQEGKRFSGNVSVEELMEWVNSLGIDLSAAE